MIVDPSSSQATEFSEGALWTPSPERVETTRMAGLMSRFGVEDYPALHRFSVDAPESTVRCRRSWLRRTRLTSFAL